MIINFDAPMSALGLPIQSVNATPCKPFSLKWIYSYDLQGRVEPFLDTQNGPTSAMLLTLSSSVFNLSSKANGITLFSTHYPYARVLHRPIETAVDSSHFN
jgi:hypothetical protein